MKSEINEIVVESFGSFLCARRLDISAPVTKPPDLRAVSLTLEEIEPLRGSLNDRPVKKDAIERSSFRAGN